MISFEVNQGIQEKEKTIKMIYLRWRNLLGLTVGAMPVVDFTLTVGQTTTSVNVSAEVSQVDTTSSQMSSLVNQTQMHELPLNGRDYEQLILLAPGVLAYPQGGSSSLTSVANAYSIAGTRPEGYDAVQPYFEDDWKVTSRLTINLGLRYDWEINPIETRNNYYNVVGPPFGTGFQNVPHAYVTNPANKNFDPRIGLAWDVFGDHKTSLRAGFGIFHDPYTTYTFSSAYTSNPPYLTENQFFLTGDPNWPTPFVGGGTPLLSQTNGTYYGTNTTPYSLEYTLSIQRELPKNNLLTVGYQNTEGVHLLAFHDFNAPVPTVLNGIDYFALDAGAPCVPGSAACTENARPNPNFGALDMTDPGSHSSYDALEVGLTHRASSNLVYQFSYMWSHCIDGAYTYGGLGFNNGTSAITNPYDWAADRGNCAFDLRHNVTFNAVYVFPFKGTRWKEGWQLTGITTWHTGVPFSLNEGDQADLQNNFDSERPNLVYGCNLYANQTPTQWFNPACFAASTYGTVGNLGRNNIVGPGFAETDIGLTKVTRINERLSLQLRGEVFNVFNHPNFNPPSGAIFTAGVNPILSPVGAQITSLVGSGGLPDVARQTQFSAKVVF